MVRRGMVTLLICTAFFSPAAIGTSIAGAEDRLDIFQNAYLSEKSLFGDMIDRKMSPRQDLYRTVQEVCCPGGYPWYRESTNTCYGSYEDCHNTNGGGWSCRQVNAC